NLRTDCLIALAIVCSLVMGRGNPAFGQVENKFNTFQKDADCLFSETPVPGVRIVRLKDYSRRPANYLFNDEYTTLAAARETSNRFAVFDFQVPPFGGPIPHTHGHEWEIFFVDQGMV